mgnify:CR=1 FL=1
MDQAARVGDIFITATGMKDIIVGRHFDERRVLRAARAVEKAQPFPVLP